MATKTTRPSSTLQSVDLASVIPGCIVILTTSSGSEYRVTINHDILEMPAQLSGVSLHKGSDGTSLGKPDEIMVDRYVRVGDKFNFQRPIIPEGSGARLEKISTTAIRSIEVTDGAR